LGMRGHLSLTCERGRNCQCRWLDITGCTRASLIRGPDAPGSQQHRPAAVDSRRFLPSAVSIPPQPVRAQEQPALYAATDQQHDRDCQLACCSRCRSICPVSDDPRSAAIKNLRRSVTGSQSAKLCLFGARNELTMAHQVGLYALYSHLASSRKSRRRLRLLDNANQIVKGPPVVHCEGELS